MRRLALILLPLALWGCGQNPLMKAMASDYMPLGPGFHWEYAAAAGGQTIVRHVVQQAPHLGRQAYQMQETWSGVTNTVSLSWLERTSVALNYAHPLGAWTLYYQLPFLIGNRWEQLPQSGELQRTVIVDDTGDVTVPAGRWARCYKIRTLVLSPGPAGTTLTTQTLAWAAPDIGIVKLADMNAAGEEANIYNLTSSSFPR
jgi:hypothetical protein